MSTDPKESETEIDEEVLREEQQSRRRVRNLLQDYYGIVQEQKITQSDPIDIDSHSFNPDAFFHELLKRHRLPGLIEEDNKMSIGRDQNLFLY
jgi:hypothetical protein